MIMALAALGCAHTPEADDSSRVKSEPDYSEMILVPAGEFIMGSDPEDEKRGIEVGIDELPQRKVYLPAFYIDKYEATNGLYKKFVHEAGNKAPFDWKDGFYPEGEKDFPVAHIDWHDADAYCKWAGKRLPTEAEWEKAARGVDGRIYPWGDAYDMKKANTKDWDRERVSAGSFPGGASPYGALDMAGNVWEWTADWYEGYPGSALERSDFGRTYKVLRGGGWNARGELVRSNERYPYRPEQSYQCFIGVRCVKDP